MNQRFEVAKAALTGLLANPNRTGGEQEYANDALRFADALLSALNITPEAVVESQQVAAGLSRYLYVGESAHGLTDGRAYCGRMMDNEFVFRDDDNDIRVWPVPHRNLRQVPNA